VAMRFVQREGVWDLVEDGDPAGVRVIATLKNEVEVLALHEFSQRFLVSPRRVPEHFQISHKGTDYTVTPLGAAGEKLALVVAGSGFSSTIATAFTLAPGDDQG
jgi:hypothetical protein